MAQREPVNAVDRIERSTKIVDLILADKNQGVGTRVLRFQHQFLHSEILLDGSGRSGISTVRFHTESRMVTNTSSLEAFDVNFCGFCFLQIFTL